MTIEDLVYGPVTTDLSAHDRAAMIAERVAQVAEMEAELEDLRGQLNEERDFEEENERLREILRRLVDAIDGAQLGKISAEGAARVGALVIVESSTRQLAPLIGDVLEEARKAL